MRGLNTLGWRNLRHRKVRYALTALGIVLGVANVFGVFVANATTNRGLEEGSRSFFGNADVIVSPKVDESRIEGRETPTFSESTLAKLRGLDGVEAVGPRPVYARLRIHKDRLEPIPEDDEASGSGQTEGSAALFLGGFDVIAASRERTLEEGRMFVPRSEEVIVSRDAARRLGKGIGDSLEVRARRTGRLKIVGIYTPTDPGFSESLADRDVVNRIFGAGESSAVFVYLEAGVAPDVWALEHERDLPELQLVQSQLPSEFREFLDVIQNSLTGSATIALFVGAFLIYLTFTMTVVERTRLYGTLQAVGATGAQVRRAVLAEALSLGAAATIAGMVLGLALASGLVRLMARVAGAARVPLAITPGALAAGLTVGVLATLAGALVPAIRAGRISPVEAIRGSLQPKARTSRAWIFGVAAAATGLVLHFLFQQGARLRLGPLTGAPTLFLLLGAVLLVPTLVPLLARGIRRLARRLSPGLGNVAVMHLVRERTRSAYTLGLVMVVLAMILTLGAAHASLGAVVNRWVDTRFGAELIVYGEDFPPDAQTHVQRIEGVRAVTPVTFDRVRVVRPNVGRVQNLVVVDPSTFFQVAGFPWADGDDASAREALIEGGAVFLPATAATRFGVERGDTVSLQARGGPRDFTLVATYASIAAGPEVGFVAGIRDGREFFGTEQPNVLYIAYNEGARAGPVTRAVERELAGAEAVRNFNLAVRSATGGSGGYSIGGYFFITGADIKAEARRALNTYVSLFLAVLLVGMLVGLLGLANTLATSVMQRYREIGALQAVGASPKDVRRMILIESGALVLAALVLSVLLGASLGRIILAGGNALLGFSPPYVFPWVWVPALAVLAVVVALTAAIAPARRVAKLTPIEALRYE